MVVSRQFNYTKGTGSMPFILPTLLGFQGSTHRFGVGSFSNLTSHDKGILEIVKNSNGRKITNETVIQQASILDKVSPEVANNLIAQIPEVFNSFEEVDKNYTDILKKGMDSIDKSTESCFESEDYLISVCSQEAMKDISFEEKKYFIGKAEEAVKRKEEKDTEHKNAIDRAFCVAGGFIMGAGVLITGFIFGKSNFGHKNDSKG